jgi:DNA polymerase III subunit gamma/tau
MIEQNGGAATAPAANPTPRGAPPALMPPSPPPPRSAPAPRSSAEAAARPQAIAASSEPQPAPVRRIAGFPELVALATEKRDLQTRSALESDVRLVRIEDGRLEVALERTAARTLINDLSRKLEQWTGRRWTVIVSNEAGQPTLRSQNEAARNLRERAAESDPRVQEVLARFPGAKVVEVRKLAAEPPESHAGGEESAESSDGDD